MIVSLVAAVSENGAIGKDNDLPWHLPDEFAHFKRLTRGHCIVMGRHTFESIGRPLPDRTSIVVTRKKGAHFSGATAVANLEAAFAFARERKESECFVAGGAALYEEALPMAHCLYLTRVHAVVKGDTFFPEIDASQWEVSEERHHPIDDRHVHAFTIQRLDRRARVRAE